MKKTAIAALVMAASFSAHAESFFQIEVGMGEQVSRGMGDGTWQQQGVAVSSVQLFSKAYVGGFTGELLVEPKYDIRWHVDYLYFGQVKANCVCVPDANYNPIAHTASEPGYIPFNGFGHTQGVIATLDAGYEVGSYRVGVNAGPWFYWATWHESRLDPAYPNQTNLSHKTTGAIGWTAGLSVSNGNSSLEYRYLSGGSKWNPFPGMINGTHMLMYSHRF
jgi:hypothetical protein